MLTAAQYVIIVAMKPSNNSEQEPSTAAYIATLGDLKREQICFDILLPYCQAELKRHRQRAYRWERPDNTLVHTALAQVGIAARKSGVVYPFASIGFFLLLALLLLPITLFFQIICWVFNKACYFADWWRDLRQLQQLSTVIREHHSACGDIYSLWSKFSPCKVGLSRYEGQSLLAVWLSILYGETSGHWAQQLDHAHKRQTSTLVKNHAAFERGEVPIRICGHATPWTALRALRNKIPERYLGYQAPELEAHAKKETERGKKFGGKEPKPQ